MKVSIIIPVVRRWGYVRCASAIRRNAGIADNEYEIVAAEDKDLIGCPKMVRKLTARAKCDLVMFLGDDTVPLRDFMAESLSAMSKLPDGWGMVGLNDQVHDGNLLATHWLASKKLLPLIGGEFFHTGYHHTFCDMELTERAKALGRYVWARDAKLIHDHPLFTGKPADSHYQRAYKPSNNDNDRALFEMRKNLWECPK